MANTSLLVTPTFRAGFVALVKPYAQKKEDGSVSMEYSVRACFPPDADLSSLKAAAEQAVKAKWTDKIPKGIRSPFRLNEDLDNPVPGIPLDWTIMTFTSKEAYFSPSKNLVDGRNQPILDETDVYSGAWFRAQVSVYAYEAKGNKGVSFGLRNVQKVKDDKALGVASITASKAFEPVETSGSKGASDIFG